MKPLSARMHEYYYIIIINSLKLCTTLWIIFITVTIIVYIICSVVRYDLNV